MSAVFVMSSYYVSDKHSPGYLNCSKLSCSEKKVYSDPHHNTSTIRPVSHSCACVVNYSVCNCGVISEDPAIGKNVEATILILNVMQTTGWRRWIIMVRTSTPHSNYFETTNNCPVIDGCTLTRYHRLCLSCRQVVIRLWPRRDLSRKRPDFL